MSDQDTFMSGIEILDSTTATSSTASLYTYGGISIFNTSPTFTTSASFLTLGGMSILKNTIIGGDTTILSTTISTTTSTGSLIIGGGLGIQGSLYGNLANLQFLQATTSATIPNLISSSGSFGNLLATNFSPINITTSNLYVTNATSMANALFTNITTTNMTLNNNFSSQTMSILGTVNSVSTSTGTIIISGGMGVNQSIFAKKGYYGDRVNDANNNRPLNLVDTLASISCWRWVPPTGANSGNPAIELIAGTGGTATTPGNNYWDIYLDDSDCMTFRRRTQGVSSPFLFLCSSGNVAIGNTSTMSTASYKLDVDGIIRTRSTANSTSITSGALIVNGGVGITNDINIGGNMILSGNLTVNGTSISVNSTNVNISDNIIIINSAPSGISDAGILTSRYQIANDVGTGDIVTDIVDFTGILQTGTNTSQIILPAGASSVNDFYKNYWIKITSGTANNNVRQITAYTGGTKTASLATVLSSAPTINVDTVNLYGNVYVANYFKESSNEFTLSFTNSTPGSLLTDTNYANLKLKNLTASLISSSNLIVTNATFANLILPSNVTFNNLLTTNITSTNILATNLSSVNSILTNITSTNISSTNITSTSLFTTFSTIGNLVINSTNDALSSTSGGSILTNGGISVAKSIDIGSTVNAINTSTGALIVSGGAGFNGDIYAKNIYSNGVLSSNSSIYGSEYNSVSLVGTAGTTSATYTLRTSMTTSSLLGGTYAINVGFTYDQNSSTSADASFLALLDPTNLSTGNIVHNTVDRSSRSTFVTPKYSSKNIDLTSGNHIISLIWKAQANGQNVVISNVKLELFRIS